MNSFCRETFTQKYKQLNSYIEKNILATTCLNDEWEVDNTGTCVPKPENFILQCKSNGIGIELSKKLIPDAKEIIFGNCDVLLDDERQGLPNRH